MGKKNRPDQEADMRQGHPQRYLVIAVFPGLGNGVVKLVEHPLLGSQAGELPAEKEKIRQIGNDDSGNGLPSEMLDHVSQPPVPLFRHHHYGWSCKVRQGAPDGDIHEEKPQSGVHQGFLRLEVVKFLA